MTGSGFYAGDSGYFIGSVYIYQNRYTPVSVCYPIFHSLSTPPPPFPYFLPQNSFLSSLFSVYLQFPSIYISQFPPSPPLPPLWLIMCHGSHFPTFPIFFFCERSAGSSGSWIFLYSHLREATKTYEQCFGSRWICFFSPIRKRTSKTRILIHPFFAFVYSKITDEN